MWETDFFSVQDFSYSKANLVKAIQISTEKLGIIHRGYNKNLSG